MGEQSIMEIFNGVKQSVDGVLGLAGIVTPDQVKKGFILLEEKMVKMEASIKKLESRIKKLEKTPRQSSRRKSRKRTEDDDDY